MGWGVTLGEDFRAVISPPLYHAHFVGIKKPPPEPRMVGAGTTPEPIALHRLVPHPPLERSGAEFTLPYWIL